MNENQKTWLIACIVIAYFVLIQNLFTGCATTNYIDDTTKRVVSDFAKFEESFGAIEQRIERATELGSTIEDEVGRVIYLFGQYDSAVSEILSEIDRYRKLVEKYQKEVD